MGKTAVALMIFKINVTFLLLKGYAVFPSVNYSFTGVELGTVFGKWVLGNVLAWNNGSLILEFASI